MVTALRADVDRAEFLSSCASGLERSGKAGCKHQCEQSWKAQHPTLSAQADGVKSKFSIQGGVGVQTQKCKYIFNPHQRCGYSDSPFARKDTFLYCKVQKGVGSGVTRRDMEAKLSSRDQVGC